MWGGGAPFSHLKEGQGTGCRCHTEDQLSRRGNSVPLNKSHLPSQTIQDVPLKEGEAGLHSWPFPGAGGWNLPLSNTGKYKIGQAAHSSFPWGGSQ